MWPPLQGSTVGSERSCRAESAAKVKVQDGV